MPFILNTHHNRKLITGSNSHVALTHNCHRHVLNAYCEIDALCSTVFTTYLVYYLLAETKTLTHIRVDALETSDRAKYFQLAKATAHEW
jgi:hypothetical protein